MADLKIKDAPAAGSANATDKIPVSQGTNLATTITVAQVNSIHEAKEDPHAQYLLESDASVTYEPKNTNIQSHISSTLNPHNVTYTQVGAEQANANIQQHISSTSNPHSVTHTQVGAEPANANIQSHISSTSNPHSVTATQVGLGNVLNATQEVVSAKGQALGYCPLDGSAKVSGTYLPDSVLGQVDYQGVWNATTNNPTIPAADSTNKGHYYIVSVSGTTLVDGISDWTIGDWIISNGVTWNKVDNTDSVSSVFGRAGAIVANSGDYTASQVTNVPQGNIAAITVQAAIDELDLEKEAVGVAAGLISTHNSTYDHTKLHDPVTVADSTSIDLAVTGQQISASAIFGTTSGTVCQGNDTRLSDARTPTSHTTDSHSDWPVAVSMTEVGYLDGATSVIQTQLNNKQPLDATLTALAGVTTAADKLPYATGPDQFATTDITAFARTLLAASDAVAWRIVLDVAASDEVVKLTGDQTIAGAKTFVSSVATQELYVQHNRIDTSITIPDGQNGLIFGDFEIGPDATITCLGNATFTAIG